MINSFTGQYRFLSNFWKCPVVYDGLVYPTAEHAYQAAKTTDLLLRETIRSMPRPGQAKKAGSEIKDTILPGWFDVTPAGKTLRYEVMKQIVNNKFSAPNFDIIRALMKTRGQKLEEGNSWGDTFWGVYSRTRQGDNHLGKILMEIRDVRYKDYRP